MASVAHGQLINLFGTGLGPEAGREHGPTGEGSLPLELAGVRVSFDGLTAPLLYVSATQINAVVPYEVAGAATRMELFVNGSPVDQRTLAVAARDPRVFSNPDLFVFGCSPYLSDVSQGAWNEDATPNTCGRPAKAGSTATLFLNGLGDVTPHPATGVFNPKPAGTLSAPVEPINLSGPYGALARIVSAGGASGQVSGVWRIDVFLPENPSQSFGPANPAPFQFGLAVDGVRVRPEKLVVWVAP